MIGVGQDGVALESEGKNKETHSCWSMTMQSCAA